MRQNEREKARKGERDKLKLCKQGEGEGGKRLQGDSECVGEMSVGMSTGGLCAVLLQPYNILYCQDKTAHHGHPKPSPYVFITVSDIQYIQPKTK